VISRGFGGLTGLGALRGRMGGAKEGNSVVPPTALLRPAAARSPPIAQRRTMNGAPGAHCLSAELPSSSHGWEAVKIESNSRSRLNICVSVIGHRQRTRRSSILANQPLIAWRNEDLRSIRSELPSSQAQESILDCDSPECAASNRAACLSRILRIKRAVPHRLVAAHSCKRRSSAASDCPVIWGIQAGL
jgi:hypothetical protein